MRLAFLADIHGNLPALEAAAADLRAHAPDAVYLLGDQVNRCPFSGEVLDFLAAQGWPAIYGNHDWVVGRINTPANAPPFTSRRAFPSLWWTQERLRADQLDALRALPADLCLDFPGLPALRLLHGVPGNPFAGLYPFALSDTLLDALRTVDQPVVVAAHTHRPMDRTVGSGLRARRILNGGSVGLPYNDDPRAQYLLLDGQRARPGRAAGWKATLRAVDYDHEPLRAAFYSSGMLDAVGPTGELHLRTAMTAQPWSSDFGQWMHSQPPELHHDMARAVQRYLASHGPGRWVFSDQ